MNKLGNTVPLPFAIDELVYEYTGITTNEVLKGIGLRWFKQVWRILSNHKDKLGFADFEKIIACCDMSNYFFLF